MKSTILAFLFLCVAAFVVRFAIKPGSVSTRGKAKPERGKPEKRVSINSVNERPGPLIPAPHKAGGGTNYRGLVRELALADPKRLAELVRKTMKEK